MYLSQLEAQMEKWRSRRRVVLCRDQETADKILKFIEEYGVQSLYKVEVNALVPDYEVWVIQTPSWDKI